MATHYCRHYFDLLEQECSYVCACGHKCGEHKGDNTSDGFLTADTACTVCYCMEYDPSNEKDSYAPA